MARCSWVKEDNPLYVVYHDEEWGRPLYDEQKLFELLSLETYQAGLSWETVLRKREAFKQCFYNYEIEKVAQMTDEDLELLLENSKIIRHRLKLASTRANAQAILKLHASGMTFNEYVWSFVGQKPMVNQIDDEHKVPVQTELSKELSKDLKKKGFKFVGPVTVYSFLQAAGLINDHENRCSFKFID